MCKGKYEKVKVKVLLRVEKTYYFNEIKDIPMEESVHDDNINEENEVFYDSKKVFFDLLKVMANNKPDEEYEKIEGFTIYDKNGSKIKDV